MSAQQEVFKRIESKGKVTFAEFMEAALYWPDGGHYSNADNVGPSGDFYTAPSAHPAFGALLCVQAFQMWQTLGSPQPFQILELGAGNGLLCHDFIGYSAHLPADFQESIEYICVDRSVAEGVESQLEGPLRERVSRSLSQDIPAKGLKGLVLSNELLDSFPVHRVKLEKGSLREIYITLDDGHLIEVLDKPSTPALYERLAPIIPSLPDGFTTEVNLSIGPWLDSVSQALEKGFVLTVDYGHPAHDLYSPTRTRGTLTCFYKHVQTDDPYSRIGQQDMTAHVDFTAVVEHGERNGLETVGLTSQREFLNNLGLQELIKRLAGAGLAQREMDSNRMAMVDIARLGGLGGFKVLVQGKGVGTPDLWGFRRNQELRDMLEKLPVPLRTALHTPLMEGRYPHHALGWEDMLPG